MIDPTEVKRSLSQRDWDVHIWTQNHGHIDGNVDGADQRQLVRRILEVVEELYPDHYHYDPKLDTDPVNTEDRPEPESEPEPEDWDADVVDATARAYADWWKANPGASRTRNVPGLLDALRDQGYEVVKAEDVVRGPVIAWASYAVMRGQRDDANRRVADLEAENERLTSWRDRLLRSKPGGYLQSGGGDADDSDDPAYDYETGGWSLDDLGEPFPPPSSEYVDIVFDGPSNNDPGLFIEVEDQTGASTSFGRWVNRADGYWVLRIDQPSSEDWEPTNEQVKRACDVMWGGWRHSESTLDHMRAAIKAAGSIPRRDAYWGKVIEGLQTERNELKAIVANALELLSTEDDDLVPIGDDIWAKRHTQAIALLRRATEKEAS